jgi:alpha-glucosidase (family GH31 glycosyl hydrolase)
MEICRAVIKHEMSMIVKIPIFLLSAATLFAQNVSDIQQSGASILVTIGPDIVSITPCSSNMVSVEYRTGENPGTPSEIVDPGLVQNGTFTGVQLSSDPAVLTGNQYSVKVYKSPFLLEFDDKSGTVLFKTSSNGFSANSINATLVSGTYYGAYNDQWANLVFSGSWTINAGANGYGGSPFIWTTNGFGILADAEAGTLTLNATAFSLSRGSCKNRNNLFFLMAGTPRQIMSSFYKATGPFPMPPKYALGFMNSQWGINEDLFKGYVTTYRAKSIPIDLFIFDYDWFTGGTGIGSYCWNGTNFPSAPSGALKQWCDGQGMKMMGIRKPRDASNNNIDFYDSLNRYNYWNNFISASCNPYVRGISAYWNDEADVYGGPFNFLYMQKAQYAGQRSYGAANNARVFSLNRNYFAGAHRYAYGHWSGDIYGYWPTMTDMRRHMLASINLGSAWWSEDIGGFKSLSNSEEQYIRWMQMGAFTPIYRVHGDNNMHKQPWLFGTQAEVSSRIVMNLRYRLMPYLYSAYHQLYQDGIPPVRPLLQDYPSDSRYANYFDAWMFGDEILAAPQVDEYLQTKTILLPSGTWYDFWTGLSYSGAVSISVPSPIDRAPLMVRAGSIIPMTKFKKFTHDKPDDTLEIRIYKGANGSFTLYEDDDSSYAYEKGASSAIKFDWTDADSTLSIGQRAGSFDGMLSSRVFNIVIVDQNHGIGPDTTLAMLFDGRVSYNGTATQWTWNKFACRPETLTIAADPGSTGNSSVSITNQSTTQLSTLVVHSDSSWTITNVNGTGNQQTINVSVQPGSRKSGLYFSKVIVSAPGSSPTFFYVKMKVNGPGVPQIIRITPSDTEVSTGATAQFSSIVTDQFGAVITGQPVSWSVSGGCTISSAGLFSGANTSGSYFVNASISSQQISSKAVIRVGTFSSGLYYRAYKGFFDSPMKLDTATHPIDSGTVSSFDVSRWTDSVGVQFFGYFTVAKEDDYTIKTYGSYGDVIFIDDALVVGAANTLPWNPSEIKIRLTAGKHKLKVYFVFCKALASSPALSIDWSSASMNQAPLATANVTHFDGPYPPSTIEISDKKSVNRLQPFIIRQTRNGFLIAVLESKPHAVEVVSLNGTIVRHWSGNTPATYTVSPKTLSRGMYIVRVVNAGKCLVSRVALF